MPLLVTMHTYSGVPDPQWIISGNEEKELRDLTAAAGTAGIAVDEVGGLGYRGFTVIDTVAGTVPAPLFMTTTAAGAQSQSHSIAAMPEIEEYLLWTGHEHVSDALTIHARDVMQQSSARLAAVAAAKCPPCGAHDAPGYNPAIWNTPQRQPYNNRYNYANDQATNTFAQPGRATGHPAAGMSCAGVRPSAQSDGLVSCANFSAPLGAGAGWYVALVIWPGQDYHWYRQDNVGCWSHKPGSTAARNVDNSGHQIVDPHTCNRGPYTAFGTFMITKRTVHIR